MRGHDFRLLVVWTILAFIGQPTARAYREPSHPQAVSVNFSLYSDYLIVVRGSAGPLKDLNFLLDTGTSPTILNQRLAQRLHLNPTPATIAVLNGNVQGAMATVPSLQFGPIRKDNLPVLIRDLSALQLPMQLDGIVGLDVLGQSNFVIDYTSHTISFGASSSMPASIPLQLKDGLAIVDATVNRAPVHLVLDTGAPSLVLFAAAPDPAPQLIRAALPKSLGHVGHKPIRLASFTLGPSEFGHESAFMVRNPADAGHAYDGLMSPTALGITQVAIDLAQHTLAFTRTP
jgi:hypothetical protein